MPKGLLVAAFDFSTAHTDEFHDWYDLEHIPERQAVPSIVMASPAAAPIGKSAEAQINRSWALTTLTHLRHRARAIRHP